MKIWEAIRETVENNQRIRHQSWNLSLRWITFDKKAGWINDKNGNASGPSVIGDGIDGWEIVFKEPAQPVVPIKKDGSMTPWQ
jgi:hypothetical protein